jgi:hypothetical protein
MWARGRPNFLQSLLRQAYNYAMAHKMAEKYPDLKCTTPGYCFIIYLDDEYKEKDTNVE